MAPFGTRCQADYESGWQGTLPYMWERCGWFNDELNDTDNQVFYWNLDGAQGWFAWCDACGGGGPDDVRLFYVGTHGSATTVNARLVMWNNGVRARSVSDGWRYGDNGHGLAFLAQYACATLSNAGSGYSARWTDTFAGGLYMALGSHNKLWDGITTNETGEDFADGLQKGKSVKWAWFDGNSDWATDQAIAVLASGSTSAEECRGRRDAFTWQKHLGFARLRDGDFGWLCRSKIDP